MQRLWCELIDRSIHALTGFGAALIFMPALSVIYGPVQAVLPMTLMELPATAFLLPTAIRHADWRAVMPLGLASLVTIPAGAWLLVILEPAVLQTAIAVLVLGFGGLLATGWRYSRTPSLPVVLAVGGVSGLIGGAANLSGPPVVIFLLAGRNSASQVRAGMMAFFCSRRCCEFWSISGTVCTRLKRSSWARR